MMVGYCWKKLKLKQKHKMVMSFPVAATAYEIQQCFIFYCRFLLWQMSLLRFFLCQRWGTQHQLPNVYLVFIFLCCCFAFWLSLSCCSCCWWYWLHGSIC